MERPFTSKNTKIVQSERSVIGWEGDQGDGWNNEQGDGWTDGMEGDTKQDSKEKRKLELQKKREERKLQRELTNKQKRTKSSGAMKLGAVKKGANEES